MAVGGRHGDHSEGLVDIAIGIENVFQEPLWPPLPHAVELRADRRSFAAEAMAVGADPAKDSCALLERCCLFGMVRGHASDQLLQLLVGWREIFRQLAETPVKIGDTVDVTVSVAELMPEKFRARLACTCSVGDDVVLDGEAWVKVPSKEQGGRPLPRV